MVNALFVIALTASLAVLAESFVPTNYCNLESCNGPTHTLCKYPFHQPSNRCGRVTSSVLTPDEVQELTRAHKNLPFKRIPITWDRELALIAQTWADQCLTTNDQCRNTRSLIVTQRYYYTKTTGPFKTRLADLVRLDDIPERTMFVGCGAMRYSPNNGNSNWTLLVCNYGRRY